MISIHISIKKSIILSWLSVTLVPSDLIFPINLTYIFLIRMLLFPINLTYKNS